MLADEILTELRQRPDAPVDDDAFLAWCNEPDAADPRNPPDVSRFLYGVLQHRPDLWHAFRGLFFDELAVANFFRWAREYAVVETGAPVALIPTLAQISDQEAKLFAVSPKETGVGVLGFLQAAMGLGEAARRLVTLLVRSDEKVSTYAYNHTLSPLVFDAPVSDDADNADVIVTVLPPLELRYAGDILGDHRWKSSYRIALVFWETEVLPDELCPFFSDLDELWVTSEFTKQALSGPLFRVLERNIPIFVLPFGADVPVAPAPDEMQMVRSKWSERLGVAEGTVVGAQIFDYSSRVERKNPVGLINAWKKAFPVADPQSQILVFKTINAAQSPDQVATVRDAVARRTDVYVIDEALPPDEMDALLSRFDVVISLHRAEGYGLTLLEAMARKIPVIATGKSGNLAFMNDSNSWLIPSTQMVLDHTSGPYAQGSSWAEPDLDIAASTLRYVVQFRNDPAVLSRVDQAYLDASSLREGAEAVSFIKSRLAEIRRLKWSTV
jgi:glycosyltransferase involved in cell wall biosynthesis